MPLEDFDGETFVAFLDISGFKQLMKEEKAWEALDCFYNIGYEVTDQKIKGIFVSDCGILFWGGNLSNLAISDKRDALDSLLYSIAAINRKMSTQNFILTTSIAYGNFKFQRRIETSHVRKNPIYGDAYLNSFLDNENGTPRIQPGQCRIVTKNLPTGLLNPTSNYDRSDFIRRRGPGDDHYYYYWMVNEKDEIDEFEKDYKNSYSLKYMGMIQALKRYSQ